MKRLYFILNFCLLAVGLSAQNTAVVKELEQKLLYSSDTARIKILDDLAWNYLYINPEKSYQYSKKALLLLEDFPRAKKLKSNIYNDIGTYFLCKPISGQVRTLCLGLMIAPFQGLGTGLLLSSDGILPSLIYFALSGQSSRIIYAIFQKGLPTYQSKIHYKKNKNFRTSQFIFAIGINSSEGAK